MNGHQGVYDYLKVSRETTTGPSMVVESESESESEFTAVSNHQVPIPRNVQSNFSPDLILAQILCLV